MTLSGKQLIGQEAVLGTEKAIHAENPATGEAIQPAYPGANLDQVRKACQLANEAFDTFRALPDERRAVFLETCAEEILAIGDQLVERAMAETGLPRARIEGERGRTCGQLKLFAGVIRSGDYQDVRIDPAMPDRAPMPRVDLRLRKIPLGPVAIFGASNFPLAFSVAGGDTASALAAGCPVIVKAHSAHPGTAELVGMAIQRAVAHCGLPAGVFSVLFGSGRVVGAELVKNPAIQAVGFTGSRSGGEALMKLAADRPCPIPVYAEMSASNPVFLMPEALKNRGEEIAKGFVGSLCMGAGQFCTNPGLVVAYQGNELEAFLKSADSAIREASPQTMLTSGIHRAYAEGVTKLGSHNAVTQVAKGQEAPGVNQCQPHLFTTTAAHFLDDASLQEEVFGASSLVVVCDSPSEYKQVAERLEGQLTVTIQMDQGDNDLVGQLIPTLERKTGRILCNGFPTGVEVCHAMVHGGPYPATSDSRTTSVGSAAIQRFVRPVCYQDFPEELLPTALKDDNPNGIPQLVDGK